MRTDDQLLDALAGLYAALDPAPDDLVDGVLARLEVEGLEAEHELLTLIEHVDHAVGTRGPELAARGTDAATALEFAGASYRLLVRISTVDGRRRIDGWVVPPATLRVSLVYDDLTEAQRTADSDLDGRFELSDLPAGRVRLWLWPLTDDSATGGAPLVTPPFEL
jgi:hypothetical protein